MKRGSGVLLHISSLPGPYGIGTMGREAYEFVDALNAAQQMYWQILPCTQPESVNSPYTSTSAFAGNPNFIDLDALVDDGLLTKEDLSGLAGLSDVTETEYEANNELRPAIMLKAAEKGIPKYYEKFEKFRREQGYWLYDYSVFEAIRQVREGEPFWEWPDELRYRYPDAVQRFMEGHSAEIEAIQFTQYIWFEQWLKLKKYANDNDVTIIGDMPIYVSANSAERWAEPEMFRRDAVAGTPPDAFAPDGQYWGNPIYDWGWMERHDFRWWASRLGHSFWLFDYVRFDHFRGIESYFAIPEGESPAEGRWDPGPGKKLIKALRRHLGDLPVIAEDLGDITSEVIELVEYCGFAGTKVLHFAFGDLNSCYLPQFYRHNAACYTGTHDNNTTIGWYQNLTKREKRHLTDYIGETDVKNICDKLIRLGMMSVADCFIMPMQDILELGEEARMNIPGTAWGNWTWRMPKDAMSLSVTNRLCRLTRTYGRAVGGNVCEYECAPPPGKAAATVRKADTVQVSAAAPASTEAARDQTGTAGQNTPA